MAIHPEPVPKSAKKKGWAEACKEGGGKEVGGGIGSVPQGEAGSAKESSSIRAACSPHSTRSSVSGRGIRVAGVTIKSSP